MTQNIQVAIIGLIPFILALCFHESAHAYVANKLGDPTAKDLGRLTLNPAPHLDVLGTIVFPLVGFLFGGFVFGWAKPVPVVERNLKWKKFGMCAVAFAGPLMNLFLALLCTIGYVYFKRHVSVQFSLYAPFELMLEAAIKVNIILAIFNLLPIPPLDGSRVLEPFLSYNLQQKYRSIEGMGGFILLILMMTGMLGIILNPPVIITYQALNYIARLL